MGHRPRNAALQHDIDNINPGCGAFSRSLGSKAVRDLATSPSRKNQETPVPDQTIAEAIVDRLAARGVKRMFGVPGGDCNLDMIEAGARRGVEFVLTRGETAAAIMASVSAELTGVPGVAMTTRGPGLASVANGAAYATLDRAPLVIIADNYEVGLDHVSHQRIDQASLLRPVLKAESRLASEDPVAEVDALLDVASAQPPGAVYLEITGERVRSKAPAQATAAAPSPALTSADTKSIEAAGKLLSKAARPVIIAGLQARSLPAAKALRNLAARWKCPVLFTYKAKGAIADTDPCAVGCYIDGAAERPIIEASDLIILFGFDPIEGPATKWRFDKPIVELTEHLFEYPLLKADVSLVGDIAQSAEHLAGFRTSPAYEVKQLERMKSEIRARAAAKGGPNISPQDVVDAAWTTLPHDARIAVDAGAHMLPVLHLWQTPDPNGVLVSRGLATMGFAVPAAIGSALTEPERPVIAFTGDGGLMMCASELATAAQNNCKLIVVVFNDSCLTLIEAKQRRRQLPNAGVNLSDVDFAAVARGYGCAGFRVESLEELKPALLAALAEDGPAVVDVVVDPSPYHEQIISLRG
jgi:acetolactate synthase-1/2/3 large subunit